mgnify:FL=1
MDKLKQFKLLSSQLSKSQKIKLYKQFVESPEAGMESIVQLASKYGLVISKQEIANFIRIIDLEALGS